MTENEGEAGTFSQRRTSGRAWLLLSLLLGPGRKMVITGRGLMGHGSVMFLWATYYYYVQCYYVRYGAHKLIDAMCCT